MQLRTMSGTEKKGNLKKLLKHMGSRLFQEERSFFCQICYRFHYETNELEGPLLIMTLPYGTLYLMQNSLIEV
jgi:hypothetical protein